MVVVKHLQKKRISQRGAGTKYYIDCSKYSENVDSVQLNTLIRNINHVAIVKAVITDDSISKKNKHIVVKIMRSSKSSEREFNIGQELFEHKLLGFIKYICLFSCYDNTNEDNIPIKATDPATKIDSKICQAEHTEKNLKKVLVMPYIQRGSIENFIWNSENVHILKNILIQTVISLAVAYDTIGFLHGDLHLGNILFKETKMITVNYTSKNLGDTSIETRCYKVVIMDFEKSETNVEKNGLANISFWNDIYIMLTRVNTLSSNNGEQINWENDEIIRFIKEAKKRKYSCERTYIINLIEMMEKSEFDFFEVRKLLYNPHEFDT
jgi:serine/threonine protein kinase